MGGRNLRLSQSRSEQAAASSSIVRRRVLSDDHVIPAGRFGARGVVHPARLQEFELLLDGSLDRLEQQAAIALDRIVDNVRIPILERLPKRHTDSQKTSLIGRISPAHV